MQLLNGSFDATKVDPSQGAGQLPVGKFLVIAESSEVKPNKAADGGYLQFNLKIIDGPNTGVGGAYRLNLYHSNQQTAEIAHRQLSALCHVTGVFMVTDSAQLHNIPFMVEVVAQTDPKYTQVQKVFDRNGNEPGKGGQAQQAAPAPVQQPAWGQQQAPQQAPAPVQGGWQPNAGGAPAGGNPPWARQ